MLSENADFSQGSMLLKPQQCGTFHKSDNPDVFLGSREVSLVLVITHLAWGLFVRWY